MAEPAATISEEAASTPASSPTASGSTADTTTDDIFVRHRVRRRDTLAGLAVKYNVTVADIKRANGFQSDTAMFGKDVLLIPTKPLPLGPEYAAWAGMIVAHYGRHPEGHLRATSAAALSELRGYYSTSPTPDRSPPSGLSDAEDDDILFPSMHPHTQRARRKQQQEVELMTTTTMTSLRSLMAGSGGGASSTTAQTPGYIEDRLRRRGRMGDEDDNGNYTSYSLSLNKEGSPLGGSPFRPVPALFGRSATEGHILLHGSNNSNSTNSIGIGNGNSANPQRRVQFEANIKEWHRKSIHWRSQLLNKLKRAASQPSLSVSGGGMGGGGGMAHAAEAALALATDMTARLASAGGSTGGGMSGGKTGRKAD